MVQFNFQLNHFAFIFVFVKNTNKDFKEFKVADYLNKLKRTQAMHMSDALVSTPVAAGGALAAIALLAVASSQIKKNRRDDLLPLMGVLGAFVFAAQMINFSIPGTGSSGHIIGGILLASLLGPWAGFLVISSVLIIQCLVFADGGLLALGCNIINMGAMTTLVAYPLIFRPLMRGAENTPSLWRIMGASIIASVVGLELGACLVTAETELSGVTALGFRPFLGLMTAIHLAIGVGEGIATGAVLSFVAKYRPALLCIPEKDTNPAAGLGKKKLQGVLVAFGVAALVLGGIISFFASSDPDGLEWSIARLIGEESPAPTEQAAITAENVQNMTAVMPGYDASLSGIAGSVMVLILVFAVTSLIRRRKAAKTA